MKFGTPGFVPERLIQARQALELSANALAEQLGISRQAIYQFEKGDTTPSPQIFEEMKSLLKQPNEFFLKLTESSTVHRHPIFYRSMASTTKSARSRAEVRLSWFKDFTKFISKYVNLPKSNIPDFEWVSSNPLEISNEMIEEAALNTRRLWKIQDDQPVPNLIRLLEMNGILVVRDDLQADTLEGLSEWVKQRYYPLIVLNYSKETTVRSRLSAAHELGHLILHRNIAPEALKKKETFKLIEDQAFRFAGAFLLPQESFLKDLYTVSLDRMRVLKPKWLVSIAAMLKRCQNLEIIDSEDRERLWISYTRRLWKMKEPYDSDIPIEVPRLLTRAFNLIVESGALAKEDAERCIGLSEKTISSFASLPDNYFSKLSNSDLTEVRIDLKESKNIFN